MIPTEETATGKPTETAPGRNQLAEEAQGTAEYAWMYSRAGLFLVPLAFAMASIATWWTDDDPQRYWQSALVTTALVAVSWIRHRRYAARARWFAETPHWWERTEEAPTLLTFPRTVRALRRLVSLGRPRRYYYE